MSKPKLDLEIHGGFPINITEVPWQVSLQIHGGHFCGGSIISENWILTAGHCIRGLVNSPSSAEVRTGSSTHNTGGINYSVKRAILHPKYSSKDADYDYGLLELENALKFSDFAKPVALADFDITIQDNTICLVTGWGNTMNSSESSLYLRAVVVQIVNQRLCNKAYSIYGGVTPRMICAGNYKEGGKDCKHFFLINN